MNSIGLQQVRSSEDLFSSVRGAADQLVDVIHRSGLQENREIVRALHGLQKRSAFPQWKVAIFSNSASRKLGLISVLVETPLEEAGLPPSVAACTYLAYGAEPESAVTLADNLTARFPLDQLGDFVQEKSGSVTKVQVRLPSNALQRGLVVIDTPVLGSDVKDLLMRTGPAMEDADACVFLLEADTSIAKNVQTFLMNLGDSAGKFFLFVAPSSPDDAGRDLEAERSVYAELARRAGIIEDRMVILPAFSAGGSLVERWLPAVEAVQKDVESVARRRAKLSAAVEAEILAGKALECAERAVRSGASLMQQMKLRRSIRTILEIRARAAEMVEEGGQAMLERADPRVSAVPKMSVAKPQKVRTEPAISTKPESKYSGQGQDASRPRAVVVPIEQVLRNGSRPDTTAPAQPVPATPVREETRPEFRAEEAGLAEAPRSTEAIKKEEVERLEAIKLAREPKLLGVVPAVQERQEAETATSQVSGSPEGAAGKISAAEPEVSLHDAGRISDAAVPASDIPDLEGRRSKWEELSPSSGSEETEIAAQTSQLPKWQETRVESSAFPVELPRAEDSVKERGQETVRPTEPVAMEAAPSHGADSAKDLILSERSEAFPVQEGAAQTREQEVAASVLEREVSPRAQESKIAAQIQVQDVATAQDQEVAARVQEPEAAVGDFRSSSRSATRSATAAASTHAAYFPQAGTAFRRESFTAFTTPSAQATEKRVAMPVALVDAPLRKAPIIDAAPATNGDPEHLRSRATKAGETPNPALTPVTPEGDKLVEVRSTPLKWAEVSEEGGEAGGLESLLRYEDDGEFGQSRTWGRMWRVIGTGSVAACLLGLLWAARPDLVSEAMESFRSKPKAVTPTVDQSLPTSKPEAITPSTRTRRKANSRDRSADAGAGSATPYADDVKGAALRERAGNSPQADLPAGAATAAPGATSDSISGGVGATGASDASADPALQRALARWGSTFRSGNMRAQLASYAPFVDPYFNMHNVKTEQILSDKQRAWKDTASYQKYDVIPIGVTDLGNGEKSVLVRKDWDSTTRAGGVFAGSEIERLTMMRIDGEWKIVGEQEVKVLRLRRQ